MQRKNSKITVSKTLSVDSSVCSQIESMLSIEPRLTFSIDADTYSKFKVTRLIPHYKDFKIQPVLVGEDSSLCKLSEHLWKENSSTWQKNMQNTSCFGTIKKRYILIPKIYELIREVYKEGDSILDVGCGDGILVDLLNKKLTNKVYGTELSTKAVEKLKEKYPKISNHFYKDNISSKKSSNSKKYDIVVASFLLSNVVDIKTALCKLYSLINKGGTLIVADLNPYYYKALGYYYKNELIPVHDPESSFFTEKLIDGVTKAVHAYRPWGYYRRFLRGLGMGVVNDYVLAVDRKLVEGAIKLSKIGFKQRVQLKPSIEKIQTTPPFYILIMKK